MNQGDFFSSEKSATMPAATSVKIEHVAANGAVTVLKQDLKLQAGEIVDASTMSAKHLRAFLEQELTIAKADNTMVRVCS